MHSAPRKPHPLQKTLLTTHAPKARSETTKFAFFASGNFTHFAHEQADRTAPSGSVVSSGFAACCPGNAKGAAALDTQILPAF
jgi:hypothetical protein